MLAHDFGNRLGGILVGDEQDFHGEFGNFSHDTTIFRKRENAR
jgi:hypothetical protein